MEGSQKLMCVVLIFVTIARLTRAQLTPAITDALNCAQTNYNNRLQTDSQRQAAGTDVSVLSITEITADIFGGGDSDQSALVNPAMFRNQLKLCIDANSYATTVKEAMTEGAAHMSNVVTSELATCPYTVASACGSNMKFRNDDGSCNNINNPRWGTANTPFIRKLPAKYGPGDTPKSTGVGNAALPGPRVISNAAFPVDPSSSNEKRTAFFIGFSQFLAHDITNTPTAKGHLGYVVSCCTNPHPHKCHDITIPNNDPFFSAHGRTCMGFHRSTEGTDFACEEGIREQINVATSFVDGSPIYGDSTANVDALVDRTTGLLKKSFKNQWSVTVHPNVVAREAGIGLFLGGDPKLNEATQLLSTNLIFFRAHNYIAEKLRVVNPGWNGDRVYQETRRIIIAFLQHIVYNEYLPKVVSSSLINSHQLTSTSSGYFTGYVATLNPSLYNAFSAATMRFGHSMLDSEHKYADREYRVEDNSSLLLVDAFFKPLTMISREQDINRGQLASRSFKCDREFPDTMKNRLFEVSAGSGADIVSLNIQRGRDHGLPSYTEYRSAYGLQVPTSWDRNSFRDHRRSARDALRSVYNDPADIDLYAGAVSEDRDGDSAVGPLMSAIIADQFHRLKFADRFWYESDGVANKFTPAQLTEIKTITMARIMCFSFEVDKIQQTPFLREENSNPFVQCSSFSDFNLALWQE